MAFYSFIREEDEDGSIFYLFVTKHNFVYTVYFKVDEYSMYVNDFPLLLQKGFALGFRKNSIGDNDKNIEDASVFNTIYKIISDFIKTNGNETILLYHCDSSDDKQSARSRLFNNWENKIEEKSLERHSVEVIVSQKDYYLGFITMCENPLIDDLKQEFEAFSYFIIQPK